MSKERLLMTMISLHHLFFGHCTLPQKNTSFQNNHLRFHTMTSKKMVCSILLSNECCVLRKVSVRKGNLLT